MGDRVSEGSPRQVAGSTGAYTFRKRIEAPFSPQVLDADVVILAGDIDVKTRGVAWAKQAFSGPVLYVPGNHEYYGGHLSRTLQKMRLAQDERVSISSYAARRLAQAFNYPFAQPVTAYLTKVMVVACCGFGVMFRHRKADPFGRFQDGHRLRTSDILQAEQHGSFWVLRTRSGSFYVVASFHPNSGRQSLQAFLKLREKGVHLTPRHVQ